ncbi:hypothetical protein CGRA01v4_09777 [Colletotrichum graminicola]|nr:hypothetical protein CGRA01v4_09777 [Colletotrichum graminicola]
MLYGYIAAHLNVVEILAQRKGGVGCKGSRLVMASFLVIFILSIVIV